MRSSGSRDAVVADLDRHGVKDIFSAMIRL